MKSILESCGVDKSKAAAAVNDALGCVDDGELYLEYAETESLVFDDGRLRNAGFDTRQGFGLRAVAGERTGFAHANEISLDAIQRAAATVNAIRAGHQGEMSLGPSGTNRRVYLEDNPLAELEFAEKVRLLERMDAFARSADRRVHQVSAALFAEWQLVEILRAGGQIIRDLRPLVRLNVSVVMADGDRLESGYSGTGGRTGMAYLFEDELWQGEILEAIRQAEVNLNSVAAPAGEMPVVLGPGWPGILLHEAVGHGLEGDFNRKGTSAFSSLMGERVAAGGVTVIDDGTIEARRGSLTIDDEGTPTERTVLIEDGILKGYMQDRLNARLMKQRATGNGRRQSHAYAPMPRMTNTFMLAGEAEPAEIIASVDDGIYAVHFGGGQVDITSGKFVFSCTEAYRIREGKVAEPLKGATLIGNGPDVLTKVAMIGNDLELDPGIGTCGKDGQSIPAGVGQPTLKIDRLTVGGTAA